MNDVAIGETTAVTPIDDRLERLKVFIQHEKIHQSEVLEVLHGLYDGATDAQIEVATEEYAWGSEDNIEIDSKALTSRGDNGLWVMAWVWLEHSAELALAELDGNLWAVTVNDVDPMKITTMNVTTFESIRGFIGQSEDSSSDYLVLAEDAEEAKATATLYHNNPNIEKLDALGFEEAKLGPDDHYYYLRRKAT